MHDAIVVKRVLQLQKEARAARRRQAFMGAERIFGEPGTGRAGNFHNFFFRIIGRDFFVAITADNPTIPELEDRRIAMRTNDADMRTIAEADIVQVEEKLKESEVINVAMK